MKNIPESAYQILHMHDAFSKARAEAWFTDTLWTWQWWLLIALGLLSWIVWWYLVDRKRLAEICLLGMFVLATVSWMDDLGTELMLWYYPYKVIPWYPQLISINYAVLPVTFTLIYQYTPAWRVYIAAMTAMSALFSWIAEPLLASTGIYQLISWKYSYSFPIYILIAVTHRWLLERILAIGGNAIKK
jgi:hypothetical protein